MNILHQNLNHEETKKDLTFWQKQSELKPDNPKPLLRLSRIYLKLAQYDRAEITLEKLLKKSPRHEVGLRLMARTYQRQKQWLKAEGFWRRASESNPVKPEYYLQLGRICFVHLNQNQKALDWFQKLLAIDPNHEEALIKCARLCQRTENWTAAAEFWRRCAEIIPSKPEFSLRVGRIHFHHLRQDREALSWLLKNLENDPDNEEALTLCARIFTRKNEWSKATEIWQRLTELQPEELEPPLQLGRIYCHNLNEKTLACKWLRNVLAHSPDHEEAILMLARLTIRQKRWAESVELWQKLSHLNPDSEEIHFQQAICHLRLRQFQQAEQNLDELFKINPDHRKGFELLIKIHIDQDQIERTEPAIQKWIDAYPEALEPVFQLASLYREQGKVREEKSLLQLLLKRAPDHHGALKRLVDLSEVTGEIEQAIRLGRRLCRLFPENPSYWRQVIRSLTGQNRFSEVSSVMKEAEKLLSSSEKRSKHLGWIAHAAGLPDQAFSHFRTALEASPDHEESYLDLSRVLKNAGRIGEAFQILSEGHNREMESGRLHEAYLETRRGMELLDVDFNLDPTSLRKINMLEAMWHSEVFRSRQREGNDSAIPGRVVYVINALVMGGAERQLINTIRGLWGRYSGLIESISILYDRLSEEKDGLQFFMNELKGVPLELGHLGGAFSVQECQEDIDPNCVILLDMLPAGLRERTIRLFWEFTLRRPAVVHGWKVRVDAGIAAALAGVPSVILSERSMTPQRIHRPTHHRISVYLNSAYQALNRLPNVTLTCNSAAGAQDYARWLQCRSKTPKVVLNGIDFSIRDGEGDAERNGAFVLPDSFLDKTIIGTAFRVTEEKRPLLWIQVAGLVAKHLPEARFLVVGDGPLLNTMKKAADENNLRGKIHFTGFSTDVKHWLKAMDLLLLTSRVEGLPNIILEAQYWGVLVVSTDVGGCRETMLNKITGWVVRDDRGDALAELVIRAIRNPSWLRTVRSSIARFFVRKRFSQKSMVKKTRRLYGLKHPVHRANPSLAVAILFFNRARQTIECLISLLAANVRIYVFNNGSDESESVIIREFCQENPNIVLLEHPANRGISAGRNRILQSSDEDWLFFIDSDCTMETADWLDRFYRHIQCNSDIEVLMPRRYNVHDQSYQKLTRFSIDQGIVQTSIATNLRRLTNVFSGGASFMSRNVFERIGWFDEDLFIGYDDYELAIRAINAGHPLKVKEVPDIFVRHDHQQSEKCTDLETAQIRYDQDILEASARHLLQKHGVRFTDDRRTWAQRQLQSIQQKK